MTPIGIRAVASFLPETILTNEELAKAYPEWSAEKILQKTGIAQRHVAAAGECASDLAEKAALALFEKSDLTPSQVDFVLLCTQSPDYRLPTTACLLQDRLGIPQTCGALDIDLGCSGYIYGLMLAKGLVATGAAHNVLLLTAETYSHYVHPHDKSTRTIFGDGAAATWVTDDAPRLSIGQFDVGTDGSGRDDLIIPAGGARLRESAETKEEQVDENGSRRTKENVFMDGAEIFNFTIRVVPQTVQRVLERNGLSQEDITLFLPHQANCYMLNFLRKKLKVPKERFFVDMEDIGNTVSASVPIALERALAKDLIHGGDRVMLLGFGVGYSWGSVILEDVKEG